MATTTRVSFRVTPPAHAVAEYMPRMMKAVAFCDGAYLICREDQPRIHFHGVLITSLRSPRQIHNAFTRHIGGGNGVHSVHVIKDDWDTALRYVCKGPVAKHPDPPGDPPVVIASQGLAFTPDAVKAAYEAYWAHSADVQRERRALAFTDQVIQRVQLRHAGDAVVRPRDVVKAVVDLTLEQKRQMNDHYVIGVARMVVAKLNDEYLREYTDDVTRRLTSFF